MNFSRKLAILTLFVLVFLSGCLNQAKAILPDVGIDQDKLNQELEIILLTSNTYKIDERIMLVVRLRSDIEIYTDNNFYVRMFVFNELSDQWDEVYDPVKSNSEELNIELNGFLGGFDNIVLSTKDEDKLNQLGINLYPTIKNEDKPIKLLIVVSGFIYKNETITDQKIGAYTLVTLKP